MIADPTTPKESRGMSKISIPKPVEGRPFALLFKEEGDPKGQDWGDHWHLDARLCVIGEHTPNGWTCQQGTVHWGEFHKHDSRINEWLDRLQVHSQGTGSDNPRYLYAWEVRYRDIYAADIHEIRVAAVLMEEITRKMEREGSKFGPCQTYGQYVCRATRALGCEYVLIPPATRHDYALRRGHDKPEWADGTNYRAYRLGEAVAAIDNRVYEWVHAVDEERKAAVTA
jgi:hypothetical protein